MWLHFAQQTLRVNPIKTLSLFLIFDYWLEILPHLAWPTVSKRVTKVDTCPFLCHQVGELNLENLQPLPLHTLKSQLILLCTGHLDQLTLALFS